MQESHSEYGQDWVGNRWAKILKIPKATQDVDERSGIVAWIGQEMITYADCKYAPVESYHIGGCI